MHVRIRTRVVTLLAAALMMTSGLYANAASHEACASQQHTCGATIPLLRCCCGHDGGIAQVRAVVEPRTAVPVEASLQWMPPHSAGISPEAGHLVTVHATHVAHAPLDLSTLFSDLRI